MAKLVFTLLTIISTASFAIEGGRKVKASDPLMRFVVQVFNNRGSDGLMGCTGTVISSDIVVTAAHCLLPNEGDTGESINEKMIARIDPRNPKALMVRFGNHRFDEQSRKGEWAPVIDFRTYENFRYPNKLEPYRSYPFNDVAVLRINSSYLKEGVLKKVAVLSSMNSLKRKQKLLIVGYGPVTEAFILRSIVRPIKKEFDTVSSFVLIDWPIGSEPYVGLNHGDSGGPAFLLQDNELTLAATDAGGETYEPVPHYLEWMRAAAKAMSGDSDF